MPLKAIKPENLVHGKIYIAIKKKVNGTLGAVGKSNAADTSA